MIEVRFKDEDSLVSLRKKKDDWSEAATSELRWGLLQAEVVVGA